MRAIIAITISIIISLGVFAQEASDEKKSPEGPQFTWETEEMDFGLIPMGIPVKAEFTFTNTGKAPLVLKDVRKTCGCTSVSFPREPIMPGRTGTITAEYDASDKGVFNKKLTVLANTEEGMHYLRIKGSVE